MSSTPDSYLFYGFCLKESGMPEWLPTGEDEEYSLYDVVNNEDRYIKENYGCSIGTCGYDDDPILMLASGPMCFGVPRPDEKPVRFFVSWDYKPVKVEVHHNPEWDVRLNQAADYLNWPKEERDIGWWLVVKY